MYNFCIARILFADDLIVLNFICGLYTLRLAGRWGRWQRVAALGRREGTGVVEERPIDASIEDARGHGASVARGLRCSYVRPGRRRSCHRHRRGESPRRDRRGRVRKINLVDTKGCGL